MTACKFVEGGSCKHVHSLDVLIWVGFCGHAWMYEIKEKATQIDLCFSCWMCLGRNQTSVLCLTLWKQIWRYEIQLLIDVVLSLAAQCRLFFDLHNFSSV